MDPLPQGRYEFYRKLCEKRAAATENADDYLPEHVGLQPYIVMEVFGRLKAAFREYRQMRQLHHPTGPMERAIVFYADIHQPRGSECNRRFRQLICQNVPDRGCSIPWMFLSLSLPQVNLSSAAPY